MSAAMMDFLLPKPDLGLLRQGNTDVEGVWQFDSGQPGRHVLITSLIHGNELCGAWALKELLEERIRPVVGKLTLIFANLNAFDKFDSTDHDASRFVDEDMNRIWSSDRLNEVQTVEVRRAKVLLPFISEADWLLDLHSMHEQGAPLLLTGLLKRNLDLAKMLGAPECVVVDAGHKDGVRLRDFGKFGALDERDAYSLLVECGFHGALSSRDVALDMAARFLVASGVIAAQALPTHWFLAAPRSQKIVKVTDAVVAVTNKLKFSQNWSGLQTISAAGTEIARDGDAVFVTPYENCTLIMPSLRQLRDGVTVVRLAQQI
jgi:predicted deacylase